MNSGLSARAPFPYQRHLQIAVCLLALLGAIGAWGIVAHLERTEREAAINSAVSQNVIRAVALEQYVRRTLEAADLAMRDAVELYQHRGFYSVDQATGVAHMANLAGDGHFWSGMSIADRDGRILASTLRPPPPSPVTANRAFAFHRDNDTDRLHVSPPGFSRTLKGRFLWLSRRIEGPEGRFAGAVAVNLAPNRLTELYKVGETGAFDLISVIGLDGITRARRTGSVLSSGEDLRGKLVMRQQLRQPDGTYLGPSGLDGQRRWFSHRRLPEYGLFVTSGVLEDAVLAPVRERAARYRAIAGFFTLFAAAAALFFLVLMQRRKRLVENMAEANRRLVEAQRLGRIGDWNWDLVNGRSEWSEALLDMYGRTPEQGSPSYDEFLSMLDPDGRIAVEEGRRRILEEKRTQRYEYIVRRDGRETHHEASAVPVVEGGKVVRLYGTDRDVTQERELERARAKLAHSSRIGAMNAMASTLAHELNQPLSAAQNYLAGSRRLARKASVPKLDDGLQLAGQQISFAGDIIRRIRAMVQDQSRTLEPVPLAGVWKDAAMLVKAADRQKSIATAAFDIEAEMVFADRVQVQQVFINLLRNALQATDGRPGRRIAVSSRVDEDATVRVTVSDNGPGFAETLGDPFSAFSSATDDGLGLGLSISRTIVEAHGGRIWAVREGGLTCVHFTLPAYPSAVAMAAE